MCSSNFVSSCHGVILVRDKGAQARKKERRDKRARKKKGRGTSNLLRDPAGPGLTAGRARGRALPEGGKGRELVDGFHRRNTPATI